MFGMSYHLLGTVVLTFFFQRLCDQYFTCLRSCECACLFTDDFLAGSSVIQDQKHTVIQTLLKVGLHINWDKSELFPSTSWFYIH